MVNAYLELFKTPMLTAAIYLRSHGQSNFGALLIEIADDDVADFRIFWARKYISHLQFAVLIIFSPASYFHRLVICKLVAPKCK